MTSGPPGVDAAGSGRPTGMAWRSRPHGGEKFVQPVGDLVGLVLGEEVSGVDAGAADVGSPRPPDVEDVAVQAGQGSAAAPQHEQRTGDAASLVSVGVVVLP